MLFSHSISVDEAFAVFYITCGMLTPFKTHLVSGIPEPADQGFKTTRPNAPEARIVLRNQNQPKADPKRRKPGENKTKNKRNMKHSLLSVSQIQNLTV